MKETAHIEIVFNDKPLVSILEEFRLEQAVNEHARLHFRGVTNVESMTECLEAKAEEALIKVYQLDTQPKSLIFQGYLTKVREYVKSSVYGIEADALSTTCQLDIKRRNRSFQDKEMLYNKLLEQVLGSKDTFTLANEYQNEKLNQFFLQYEETDWEFLVRMASRLNTVIIADPIAANPKVYVGIPKIQGRAKPNKLNYQVTKDFAGQRVLTENQYLTKGIDGLDRYQIIEPDEILELGTPVNFMNCEMKVFQSVAQLEKNTIVNRCVITTPEGFKQPPLYNQRLVGLAVDVTMKVIANPVDRVKIKFNFENETFEEAKAWPFPYATYFGAEGNTGWYVMPEPEDQLKLYFPSCDESQAFVMTAMRKKQTERMKDPNVKYYRNKHGKSIVLSKDEIVIIGKDDNHGKVLIRLNEGNGVLIYSDLSTEVSTSNGGDINLTAGRDLKVVAQNKVVLKNDKTSIYIDGNGQVCTHIKGKINSTRVPVLVGPVKPKKVLNQSAPVPYSGPQPTTTPAQEPKKNDNKNKHCHRHDEFLKELEQFPEDYRPALEKLHNLHVEWRFEAFKTNILWDKFIKAEDVGGKNQINYTANKLLRSWAEPDSPEYYVGWKAAKREVIEYYADPRNFLTEKSIFQFEKLTYDSKIHKDEGVSAILKGSFMDNNEYVQYFMEAAKKHKISPYFLASKALLEMGIKGNPLSNGTVKNYKGYYNFYNIGATGKDPLINGAIWAKKNGWDSPKTAIIEGAKFCSNEYIKAGQETMYEFKFDLITNFSHQYVENIQAAYHEGKKYYDGYVKVNALDNSFVFKIPYFEEMPKTARKLPT